METRKNFMENQQLVRKGMDVNEHERLSIITQIKVKEQCFSCSSTFYSHSKVLNNDNENNSYAKMSVKQPLAYSWSVPIPVTVQPIFLRMYAWRVGKKGDFYVIFNSKAVFLWSCDGIFIKIINNVIIKFLEHISGVMISILTSTAVDCMYAALRSKSNDWLTRNQE